MIKLILNTIPSLLSLLNKLFDPVEKRRKKAENYNELLRKYEREMGKALADNNINEVSRLNSLMEEIRLKKEGLMPYVKKDTDSN